MSTFRLDPPPPIDPSQPRHRGSEGLDGTVLLHNARWFTQIRWVVVAALGGLGLLSLLIDPEWLAEIGLQRPTDWPWMAAGVLALLNATATLAIKTLPLQPLRRPVAAILWFQIVSDLMVLTVLVHLIGTTDTVAAFAYLFHISLACIFFGRRDSLLVTLLSVCLFLGVVLAEHLGIVAHGGILLHPPASPPPGVRTLLFVLPTLFVWVVVWYLVSSLSGLVRRQDRELKETNSRLIRADEEKNLQMLRVTHDLKAPFTGIENNIQVLRFTHWNELPDSVKAIIEKIEGRSATLRSRIRDILTLGNLRASRGPQTASDPIDLVELLSSVRVEVEGVAEQKHVNIQLTGGPATVLNDAGQLKILFLNLISNAVTYSRDGGRVEIQINSGDRTTVHIIDHGIGISDEAMPRIFEDYYRAPDAARFNPHSTGLGLAIAGQIAQNLGLTIVVQSEPGKGSQFEVQIPSRKERE